MKIHNRSWPHPVLAPFRDDVLPNRFTFDFDVGTDQQNFYVNYSISLDHPEMVKKISSKDAILGLHIECRRNFFRTLREIADTSGCVTISAQELRGRTEVFCCVLANSASNTYSIDGQHDDYGTATFAIREGDFLAVTETRAFDAFFDFDPLKKISSILNIRRSKIVVDGPMEVLLGEQKLVAELSQRDYDRYVDLKGDLGLVPLLANQVVVPALMEAVAKVASIGSESDAYDEHMELRWFRSISAKLRELNVDVRNGDISVTHAVQVLVELPLRRSLEELFKLTDEGPEL